MYRAGVRVVLCALVIFAAACGDNVNGNIAVDAPEAVEARSAI